jgi:hypothetical protein
MMNPVVVAMVASNNLASGCVYVCLDYASCHLAPGWWLEAAAYNQVAPGWWLAAAYNQVAPGWWLAAAAAAAAHSHLTHQN